MRPVLTILGVTCAAATGVTAQEAELDFSTPQATVETFLEAIQSGNADVLAACFSVNAEREFAAIREKRLTDRDWAELRELFAGARIGEVRTGDDPNRATVPVQLATRSEALYLVREDDHWRIAGF